MSSAPSKQIFQTRPFQTRPHPGSPTGTRHTTAAGNRAITLLPRVPASRAQKPHKLLPRHAWRPHPHPLHQINLPKTVATSPSGVGEGCQTSLAAPLQLILAQFHPASPAQLSHIPPGQPLQSTPGSPLPLKGSGEEQKEGRKKRRGQAPSWRSSGPAPDLPCVRPQPSAVARAPLLKGAFGGPLPFAALEGRVLDF